MEETIVLDCILVLFINYNVSQLVTARFENVNETTKINIKQIWLIQPSEFITK